MDTLHADNTSIFGKGLVPKKNIFSTNHEFNFQRVDIEFRHYRLINEQYFRFTQTDCLPGLTTSKIFGGRVYNQPND